MDKRENHFRVFEHESLRIDKGKQKLKDDQLSALQLFYGETGIPYYSLIHNGVRFNEYVGVIQVGGTVIEVLPKADKSEDKAKWRKVLISMLHAIGVFNVQAPSTSDLGLQPNSILDLYFELFVKEVEYLIHQGLIKKYRKTEGNRTSLKGAIQFGKQISQNLIHKERFYVKYPTYDKEHDLHAILYKALKLLSRINTNVELNSRLGTLMLDFPQIYDIKISESLFEKIVFDRKSLLYKNALELAKLILLNYHPDVKRGTNHVLALMFDMNLVWEQFVYVSLRRYKSPLTKITPQSIRSFWKPESGGNSKIKPDIVINRGTENCIVLDTKWKVINGYNPSPEDLRQMFVYSKYFGARKVALIYPSINDSKQSGFFYDHSIHDSINLSDEECSVITIAVEEDVKVWQKKISETINDWSKKN